MLFNTVVSNLLLLALSSPLYFFLNNAIPELYKLRVERFVVVNHYCEKGYKRLTTDTLKLW